jgi:hypothetical protein
MINVLSKEALALGEKVVSELEERGFLSFDGGEQEDRQSIVSAIADDTQEVLNRLGGIPPALFKAKITLNDEEERAFFVEYDTMAKSDGITFFILRGDPQFATASDMIKIIEFADNLDDFDEDEDEE